MAQGVMIWLCFQIQTQICLHLNPMFFLPIIWNLVVEDLEWALAELWEVGYETWGHHLFWLITNIDIGLELSAFAWLVSAASLGKWIQ